MSELSLVIAITGFAIVLSLIAVVLMLRGAAVVKPSPRYVIEVRCDGRSVMYGADTLEELEYIRSVMDPDYTLTESKP